MKCPTCNNPMLPEHDRIKCVVCGYSKWDNFQVRRPTSADKLSPKGAQAGLRTNYGRFPESLKGTRV